MSPTSSETCLVAYDRNVVPADIARAFAHALGATVAELQDGRLTDARVLRPHQVLLCPEDAGLEAFVTAFERSVRQLGETPRVGLVSGTDVNDLREKCCRLIARPTRSGRPWILTDEEITQPTPQGFDRIPHAGVTPAALLELGARNAPVAVIVGHGREDIVYFGSAAFCGRRTSAPNACCQPDCCSYGQPKVPIESLSADILVILSCNAGRFGGGLMPADCRLGLSVLGASSAVIAPRRLYTHSKALTDLIVESVFAGVDAHEVAARADAFQLTNFAEERVFVLFGDPRTRICVDLHATGERRVQQRRHAAQASACQRLIRLGDALASVGICAEDAKRVGETLEPSLLSTARPIGGPLPDLSALETGLTRLAAHELQQRIGSGYFWISNEYRLTGRSETVEPCLRCGGEAARQVFGHFRYSHCDRTRLTCRVCGIVEDRPRSSSRAITGIDVSACREEVTVTVEAAAPQTMLVVGLNGNPGAGFVRTENRSAMSADPIPLTEGRSIARFAIDKERLKPGVYFFKVFTVGPDGVAEATAPIRTWEEVACNEQG